MSYASMTPYQASPRALAGAGLGAVAAAALVLTLFVLPAEYGIDPTGAGGALGLTKLAGGTEKAEPVAAAPVAMAVSGTPTQAEIVKTTPLRSDRQELVLVPHSGAEVKAHMGQGDHLIFRWQASGGQVRFDMHGEPPNAKEGEFSSYWKGKDLDSAQGAFTAPFTGTHGWYFRNRGETPVTVVVETQGFYQDLYLPSVQ
ncbi:hypothetical protein [Niveispirillum sp. KHB5.9]|uniref:hypothetical protein n=1 Tax=Niveispirillum sp. KHB5.9 TaxID=3400269 RepID=UPI003A89840A